MQPFRLLGFAFLFLWGYNLLGETCRLIVLAEEDGLNGKQGNPPGAAILFGTEVDVPSFRLSFSETNSGKAVRPLKITIAYGWRWLDYPYPEHSWGAWVGASDVFECIAANEDGIKVPAFKVRPRGWYDGKYTRFPFSKKPAFTGIGVVIQLGGCTTRATITPKEAIRLQGHSAVFKANCTGESSISIQPQ
jgi:hypothetical protein